MGHFGHIPYGLNFEGKLHWPVSNQDGCRNYTQADHKNDSMVSGGDDLYPVILIDHGGCAQIEKVNNAKNSGFRAVVLIEGEFDDYIQLRKSQHLSKDNAVL